MSKYLHILGTRFGPLNGGNRRRWLPHGRQIGYFIGHWPCNLVRESWEIKTETKREKNPPESICTTIHDFHWLLSSWYLVPPLWDPRVQGKGNEIHEALTTCNHHRHCLLLMWGSFVTFYCASVLAFTLFLSLCHLGVNTTKPWFLH